MSNIVSKLKFSRCREVLNSRGAAMLHLREREFTRGEPVLISYFENPADNSSINTLMAVGIRNGHGKDCFRLITLGQYEIVWDVSNTLPDVSSLVHDEVYLWVDENEIWWKVSAPDKVHRQVEALSDGSHIYLSLADNLIYMSDESKHVRSITDTYTKNEIDSLIATITGGEWEGLGNLERRLAEAYESIQEVIAINTTLAEKIDEMAEAAEYVAAFAERFGVVEDKVAALEVDEESGTVEATFSSITLSSGEDDEDPKVIDKDTIVTTDMIGGIIEPIPQATLLQELV